MRALAFALASSLAALLGVSVAGAEEPQTLPLLVGEETEDLGVSPRCDDLSIVAVKASGRGVRAVRPGTTLCSFDTSGGGGIRRVVRIVVSAPQTGAPPAGSPREGGARKP